MTSRQELGDTPSNEGFTSTMVACETCGLVQQVDEVPKGSAAQCCRCGFHLRHRRVNSRLRTLTFSLAALILYFPSNLYPIVTAEYHGIHSETTILQGIRSLFQDRQYFIAGLVFCTSILSPALKIIGLLFLSLTLDWPRWKKARTWIYQVIRVIDPWNMLEVFLLAISVSMIEMGRVATVHPGRGVFSFTAVVALTLLATLSFDPRLLWTRQQQKNAMNKLHNERSAPPKAVIKKARPAWLLWLVPLGAVALCVWFIYRDFVATGPLITIYFQNTDGLQEGNTQVQYRGAQVGEVKTIRLADDGQRVKVTARLTGSAKSLARGGSIFWIVRPEVKVGAISGLNTIVSGQYVTVQPGHGAPTNVFVAAEKSPPEEQPGALLITLRSPELASLQEHSSIFYRGVEVGEVLGYQLGDNAQTVMVRARVRAEYAPLVRMNSKFWNAGGIDVRIGLFKGAEISAQSAQTLLSGGIEFATPREPGEPAANGAIFELNEKPKDEWKNWTPAIPLHLPGQAPASMSPPESKIELK